MIYEHAFVSQGRIDQAKLRRTVADNVPAGWTGFACLNVENEWYKAMARDPTSEEFRTGARNLLEILKIAKEVRPEARWTYYGLPSVPFFVKDARGASVGWDKVSPESKAAALDVARRAQIVINGFDWLAPSVYDHYLDAVGPEWAEAQRERVRVMVTLAREMGAASGRAKPVFPFVWHRIHTGNKRWGLTLLDNREFIEGQVKPALEAGAAGVVWWGADRNMLNSGQLGKLRPEEAGSIERNSPAANAHVMKVLMDKLEALAPLFR